MIIPRKHSRPSTIRSDTPNLTDEMNRIKREIRDSRSADLAAVGLRSAANELSRADIGIGDSVCDIATGVPRRQKLGGHL